MTVTLDEKEIELIDELQPGELELDTLTPIKDINMEDTIEVTEEMLEKIKMAGSNNHE